MPQHEGLCNASNRERLPGTRCIHLAEDTNGDPALYLELCGLIAVMPTRAQEALLRFIRGVHGCACWPAATCVTALAGCGLG